MVRLKRISTGFDFQGQLSFCEDCATIKSTNKPYQNNGEKPTKPRQVICFDIKKQKRSHNGFEYSLDIWDKFSGEEWTFPLRRKSDAGEKLQQFIVSLEVTGEPVYSLEMCVSDQGNFSTKPSKIFLPSEESTTWLHWETLWTTALQSLVWKALLNHMQQLLLKQAGFDQSKWVLARECATFIRNRTPKCLNCANKTPYEIFFGKAPDLSSMRAFGCPCFIHTPSAQRKAWDDAARPGIFVGYSEKRRAYKFLSPAAIKSHLRGR